MIDAGAVLAWGVPRLRDLPWRRTRDPWAILVAEVMLQQTQAERVVPSGWRSSTAFPTPGGVRRRVAGRRAAAVAGARLPAPGPQPARRRGAGSSSATAASCPTTSTSCCALPGIGPYTARAVRVFAFERDEAVVETNIARLLARTTGERLTPRRVQALADALVPDGDGWTWNQVLMDLGATVCRPAPRCAECPVADDCAWHRARAARPGSGRRLGRRQHRSSRRFEGSVRQARGRVLHALADRPGRRRRVPGRRRRRARRRPPRRRRRPQLRLP